MEVEEVCGGGGECGGRQLTFQSHTVSARLSLGSVIGFVA